MDASSPSSASTSRRNVFAVSADEGAHLDTDPADRVQGRNIKLYRLRSGLVLCVYRDEDPARRGVSCSVSADGGASWRFVGQLYVADPAVEHRPGHLCGYPDLSLACGDAVACVLHTYPDAAGRVELHLLRLRDRT